MINYAHRDLFYVDGTDKQWTIVATKEENGTTTTIATFHNEDLLAGSVNLSEAITSADGLEFGRCESSKFSFTVYNNSLSLKGAKLTVSVVLGGHTDAPLQVGVYKVDSDKPTADRRHRDVTAYDSLADMSEKECKDWYATVTFPTTIKNFRDSFFNYIGIQQENTILCNDDIPVFRTLDTSLNSNISAMSVMNALCEINGAFGHIGRDNKFHYIRPKLMVQGMYPANDLYPKDDLYPKAEVVDVTVPKSAWTDVQYEDYEVKAIDSVIITNQSGNVVTSYSPSGALNNAFKIQDNFFLNELTVEQQRTVCQNLSAIVCGLVYRPCNVKMIGDLCIEVGDSIRFNTNEKIIFTYVMSRSMTGEQFLSDQIESSGKEDRSEDTNSISNQLKRLAGWMQWDYETLSIHTANIDTLNANVVDIRGQLTATRADIGTLYAQDVTINGTLTVHASTLNAHGASIGSLQAQDITLGNRLSTAERDIISVNNGLVTIQGDYVKASELTAEYINSKFSGTTALSVNRMYLGTSININYAGRSYSLSPTVINGQVYLTAPFIP